jgi:hypothetical protein
MNKGDLVVARRDLGGIFQENVPAGSKGIVTEASWGSYRVMFTISGFFGDRKVEVSVDKDDVF